MTDDYSSWTGRQTRAVDVLDPARVNALLRALGRDADLRPGALMPPLGHWLHFWDVASPAALGEDGHPARGGVLPPVPLPRRMWAGSRLSFHAPLCLGERVTRVSTILKVEAKLGRSGRLVFVTVEHRVTGHGDLAIVEQQDIVYRDAAAPGSVPAPIESPPPVARWCERTLPDPVLLFRYSALTMNGHRIHYDRPYAVAEEGYPALVVHGPLQATMLLDLAARELEAPITDFEFRGRSPAFDGTALYLCGEPTADGADLWTEQGGERTMVATVGTRAPR